LPSLVRQLNGIKREQVKMQRQIENFHNMNVPIPQILDIPRCISSQNVCANDKKCIFNMTVYISSNGSEYLIESFSDDKPLMLFEDSELQLDVVVTDRDSSELITWFMTTNSDSEATPIHCNLADIINTHDHSAVKFRLPNLIMGTVYSVWCSVGIKNSTKQSFVCYRVPRVEVARLLYNQISSIPEAQAVQPSDLALDSGDTPVVSVQHADSTGVSITFTVTNEALYSESKTIEYFPNMDCSIVENL